MKKMMSLFLICWLFLYPAFPCFATENISENTVKVGYIIDSIDSAGVDYENGMGFIEKYFLEIGKYTGRNYDVIYCELDEARVMLNSGEVDILGPMSKNDEREGRYLFINKEFGEEEVFLATSTHDPMQSGDFDAVSSATIGIADGDQHQVEFEEFLERNQLSPTVTEILEGNNTLPEGYPVELTSAFRLNSNRQIVMQIGTAPYYFVVKKGGESLQLEVDEALKLIELKEPDFATKLYEQYYSNIKYAPNYIASGDELEGYKEEYVIGYSADHNPFMYQDKSGQGQGIVIEMFNQIAEILGISVRYVELGEVDGEVDMNLAFTKDEQLDYVNIYSRNYLEIPLMMVGDTARQYAEGVKVGFVDYYSVEQSEVEYLFYDSTFYEYTCYEEMREAFAKGKLDFIIAGNVHLINDISEFEILGDISMVPIHQNIQPKIAFSNKLTTQFVDSVNSAIGRMDTGIVNSYVLKSVQGDEGEVGFLGLLNDHREVVLIGVLLVVLALVGIGFSNAHERKRKLLSYLNVDMVTGLESEKKILESISSAIEEPRGTYAVISIDIDNYKYINNTYGYEVGTGVLVDFAHYLNKNVDNKRIARVFADQYLLLLEEDRVDKVVKLLQEDEELAAVFTKKLGEGYNLSLSIGIYHVTGEEKYATDVVDSANIARAASKKMFGRVASVFSAKMSRELTSRNLVVQRMKNGIENREFFMMYQPKINLEDETVIGAEALVRWKSEGQNIFPDQFIPIFEENGFITQLDYYVIESVCAFIKDNPTVPCIAVNLSGITLLEEEVITKIARILCRYGVLPDQIQIEVTESAVIKDYTRAVQQIGRLRDEGYQIALDDFGAGESSLNRLKDFLIDVLKLDKEFLGTTLINIKGVYIIEYVIKLAKKLDLKVVAEGVETREQADILKVLGCDIAQGYLYAKPLMEDEFIARLEDVE